MSSGDDIIIKSRSSAVLEAEAFVTVLQILDSVGVGFAGRARGEGKVSPGIE